MSLASNVKAVVGQIVTAADSVSVNGQELVTLLQTKLDDESRAKAEQLLAQIQADTGTVYGFAQQLKTVLE